MLKKDLYDIKKGYFTIAIMLILITALMLGGCSSGKSADPAEASTGQREAANAPISDEKAEPTAAPVSDEKAEASAESTTDESTAPLDSDWTLVVDNVISHQTYICGFLNDQEGVTVGYGGEIHYTADGGKSWPQAQNNSACRFSVDIVDENLMWCGGNGGNVRVSKDGGKTWSAVTDINLGGMHSCIDFLDDTTGWIATINKIAATKDGGMTWTEIAAPKEAKGIGSVCLRTPEDAYLLSNNGLFFVTDDGGATWNQYELDFDQYGIMADLKGTPGLYKSTIALADISFTDENNGVMIFTGTKPGKGYETWSLTTTDGGKTWDSRVFPTVEEFSATKVFLTNDGKYLTLGDNYNHIMVYQHN